MSDGLDKDGGISFSKKNKKPYGLAEPKEEVEEPKRLDTEELLRQERLNAQLAKSKTINYSGFAINGGSIVGLLFVVDNFVFDPNTLDMLEMINTTFNLEINFVGIINILQEYKAQLIGACISFQTMLVGYKDMCQKAKDRDCDSLYQVFSEELEKVGV